MRLDENKKIGLFFVIPLIVYFIIFFIYPIYVLISYAFTSPGGSFTLSNFAAMPKDFILKISLINTLYYYVGSTVLQFGAGFLLAVLLNAYSGRLKSFFKGALFVPLTVSPVVIGLIWILILNPTYGPVDYILRTLGIIRSPVNWLGSTELAMPSIIIANGWEYIPFVFLIIYAGLQTIPKQLYEAAEIDGMSHLQTFRYITLPLIRPIMLVAFLLNSIGILQGFALVYEVTSGGPGYSTYILSYYIYQVGFAFFHMHYAAALAILFLIIVGAYVFLILRLTSVEKYLGLRSYE